MTLHRTDRSIVSGVDTPSTDRLLGWTEAILMLVNEALPLAQRLGIPMTSWRLMRQDCQQAIEAIHHHVQEKEQATDNQ